MQKHVGEELVELFRDGKYEEAEAVLENHPQLFEDLSFVLDYFMIVEKSMTSESVDVRKHLLAMLNNISVEFATQVWLRYCNSTCSTHTFQAVAPFICDKIHIIETDSNLLDDFIYELPYKLESRLIHGLTFVDDSPDALKEIVIVLNLYNLSDWLKFYKFPKLMNCIVNTEMIGGKYDLRDVLTAAHRCIPFHPILFWYEQGLFIPQVYSKTYLLKRCIEGLTQYLQEYGQKRCEIHFPSVFASFDVIKHFLYRTFCAPHIQCLDALISSSLCFLQDFYLENFRVQIFKSVDHLVTQLDDVTKLLIMKHQAQLAVQVNRRIEGDSLILAWIIDTYQKNIYIEVFQTELTSFWAYLEKVRFTDMEVSSSFYSAIANLALAQALQKIDKKTLANVKTRILDNIKDQAADYITLKEMKRVVEGPPTAEQKFLSPHTEHVHLVLYNLNHAISVADEFLSSK